ncbi:MAG: dihydroneopterin aldolase [Halothiobacillus sp. 24-54-40]|nr:dihydroneopterin aldolase [Halothiobacillaceae bacterium]OYV47384.1 MAG: dihydroneopterin aldolase [Halothiobacillus sp. 20-53-49]OYY41136.1 MAG: dihydroneopterin aldolase [Halothiobacillus sp. 35-54-62]OYY55915.1 MAG: dihydroneopterin aldolase [Halothiobacillus sp. 28-55-5]OYZ87482.1 MAG: dihydroneopterin aldolase [Halothiobacillus sp. 24-54-40]OZA81055.1 MAG: dihydroneopterin aldolase [Halothiobacillus sp. 39-53-45]HQS01599.1 dihydroneopterin aldolase [Halothiobacillus sp.]
MTKFPMGWDAAALDWITIDQLEFDCIIGIYPHERAQVQPVQINLRLGVTPVSEAARADDIAATVDYQRVCEASMAVAQTGQFQLVETLALSIVAALFEQFPLAAIQIKVSKPLALPYTQGVGIELMRRAPAAHTDEI